MRGPMTASIVAVLVVGVAALAWAGPSEEDIVRKRNGGYLGLFLREAGGALTIERVHPGSMAEKAGFRGGDVILEVDGRRLRNGDAFIQRLWSSRPFAVNVRRGEETLEIRTSTQELDALPKQGDKAPDFTLPNKDGSGTHALADLLAKGRPVVLVFGSFT